jgi:hypothetical protein
MGLAAVLIVAALGGAAYWIWTRRSAKAPAMHLVDDPWPPTQPGAARLDWSAIDGAPAPVRRYLHHVLENCRSPICRARFAQKGRLRTDGASSRWMTFAAQHAVRPTKAEFIWNAVVRAFGPLHVRVVDSLLDGRGAGWVHAMSRVRIASSRRCAEMDHGALHRFLAEAVWYPTALVPGSGLRWTAIDERRAAATMATAHASVSLEFEFNDADEVVAVYTPARWGLFHGHFEQRAWKGHFKDYQTILGVGVPMRGNVGWLTESGWHTVWEGELVAADYTFAMAIA